MANTFFAVVLNSPSGAPSAPSAPSSEAPSGHQNVMSHPSPPIPDLPPCFDPIPTLPDPVELGYLKRAEAAELIVRSVVCSTHCPTYDECLYSILQAVATSLLLFDSRLYGYDRIREGSPFLFTVILMMACKTFRPELYPKLAVMSNRFAQM